MRLPTTNQTVTYHILRQSAENGQCQRLSNWDVLGPVEEGAYEYCTEAKQPIFNERAERELLT